MKLWLFITILLLGLFAPPTVAGQDILVTSVAIDDQDGPDAQILKAVAARMRLDLFFQNTPFKRRLIMMKNGELDLICGLLKRPERERYIKFIEPAYKKRSDTVFFVPKGQAGRIQTYDDLSHLKIGTVLGSKFFPRFDKDTTLNKEAVHQYSLNFQKLIRGRIDTLISYEGGGINLIHKMKISDKVEMADYRFSREKFVYFGISKKSKFMTDIATFESVIRKMVISGEIRLILQEYYTSRHLPVPAVDTRHREPCR